MLLSDHDRTGLDGRGEDGGGVKGLDGGDVDHLGAYSLSLKGLGGLQGLPDHVTGGDDRDILALVEDIGLADLERLVRHEVGHFRPSETKVNGSVIFRGGDGRVLCLRPVARVDDHHVREDTHQSHILHGLVGGAVLAEGQSGVGGRYLDIGLAVADLHPDLVIDTACHELGERAGERDKSCEGHSGGHADHVGLGYAALEISLRKLGREGVHLQ